MSAPSPQNYVVHAIAIAIVLAVVMVLFLRHAWG
jgi:hypothetical protein